MVHVGAVGRLGRRGAVILVTITAVLTALLGFADPSNAGDQASNTEPARAAAEDCSISPTNGPESENGTVTRTVGGRSYRLHVPDQIPEDSPPMLILSLHAYTSDAAEQEAITGLSTTADALKFIVAYPQGLPDPFFPWWEYRTQVNADITYLRNVVADIAATYCVDPRHVHADGYSLGGAMSQRLACEASDVFASVSSYAANDVTNGWFRTPSASCEPDRPISIYASCGTDDYLCDDGLQTEPAWVARLACPPASPAPTDFGTITAHQPCSAGTRMTWRTLTGLDHFQYPQAGARGRLHVEMWIFFATNPLPLP
jgi:polyhydroxybutyrate depolymerase